MISLKKNKEFDKKRQEYNLKIHEMVLDMINKYPELRYNQILSILEIDTQAFNEEPWETYRKMRVKNIAE